MQQPIDMAKAKESTTGNYMETASIYFQQEDVLLNRWRINVSQTNSCTTLIKLAIRYYIRNQSFCCIGKVYLRENDTEARKKHVTSIYLSDSPDIAEWLSDMRHNGIKITALVKQILYNSIIEVSNENETWIPSTMDMVMIAQTRHTSVSENQASSIIGAQSIPNTTVVQHSYIQPMESHGKEWNPSMAEDANDNEPITNMTKENTDNAASVSVKKKPRAFALSGKYMKS